MHPLYYLCPHEEYIVLILLGLWHLTFAELSYVFTNLSHDFETPKHGSS